MRQLILDCNVDKQNQVSLIGKNYRYVVNVLRLKEGDVIDTRLKNGNLEKMEIVAISGKSATLKKVTDVKADFSSSQGVKADSIQNELKDFVPIWLFQFLPQASKMDLIVRQATECGVSVIVPILGQYSKKTENNLRFDRWERIIIEARQQSGSPVDTQIYKIATISEACELWQKASCGKESKAFVLHEDSAVYKARGGTTDSQANKTPEILAIAVGSEGGISSAEFDALKNEGFCPLHFKTNVLRTETAALYGIAVVQQKYN